MVGEGEYNRAPLEICKIFHRIGKEVMSILYNFKEIEKKWIEVWQEQKLFQWDPNRPGVYCLTMYPYPSGTLHMGHVLNYTIGDVLVRYFLAQGKNVLSPMGWDSFGLPAENAAIKAKIPPKVFTKNNIERMREQIRRAGWGYDWSLELATSHPGYYRWTQWLFLQFYRKGLAFRKKAAVNWCPQCQTVLANEQVHQGSCERCGTEIEQKDLEQWFFRMSSYAQRLLDGHKKLKGKWPENVLKLQKDWIGRSEGARLDFRLEGSERKVSVFTTRPDTVYGVTFMSIAPEHPLVEELLEGNPRAEEIRRAIRKMRQQSKIERTSEESEKEGVFTGCYVINPFNGERVQLWVANYALMDYGTGAVMAVPAHDQRDFLFAKKYGIPLKVVIQPEGTELDVERMEEAYVGDGVMVNSPPFDGLGNREAMREITLYAKERGFGDFTVSYKLKDWLLSRQRYWGAPIPVIYCSACGIVPVPEEDLPVMLPEDVEFLPTGDSPLRRCEEWRRTSCPRCGGEAERETDTMDTFVDSSWYFLRYLSPRDEGRAFDRELLRRWMPVDLYIGGIEHATMHLVYARFFTMVLKDLGLVDVEEPFERLFCQGMICKTAYRCPEHIWVEEGEVDFICLRCGEVLADQVDLASQQRLLCKGCGGEVRGSHRGCGREVEAEMAKMSKTKRNGVSPDELFERYGADTVRVGIMRLGPVDQDLVFSESVMVGEHKFLQKVYR
ncbi:MAG: leucine--tRNA ligase, partial [Planctomycetota bacterium]